MGKIFNILRRTTKILKRIANIVLGIGVMGVLSEGESLLPNLIGLVCFALLIALNKNNDDF